TGLIHYEAFRTWQGLVLPLVTALIAVVSALGIMSLASVPLDVFNATTPILILAVAAGHAVQILKRYYEEYHRLIAGGAPASKDTSRRAVVESVTPIAPVMITAGVVAALGFLSLLVFEIPSIRTFGVFTACGIISALVLEMTFIPALRCVLAPPSARDQLREAGDTLWGRLSASLAELSIDPRRRRMVFGGALAVTVICTAAAFRIRNDNDLRNYFSYNNEVLVADRALNSRLGGTNSFGVLVRGNRPDSIKDPKMLRAIEATQHYIESQPDVGKTLSIVDFIKRMNRALHDDDPSFDKLPDDEETIAQYLLLYSMSGDPGDFDSYVDYDYQHAHIWMLRKNASTALFEDFARKLQPFMRQQFAGLGEVRLGGNGSRASALNEVMVDGKIRNILQIAIVLFVLCAAVFRSFLAGLMVLVPLVITTIVNFGILGVFQIPLNIATAITTAMGVGIGADYAIYFIFRLREELAKNGDEASAFRKVFASAGKAVLFVASAVAGGYGVLVLSLGFYMHIWMGILIAAAMLVSAFAALTVLPSLLLALRPTFVFGNRVQENLHDQQEPVAVDTLA
ncbi:MAG TPA: MMPL family transporter, partial [Polyangiaceae bacterium]|nr:MMPL family transporter [Polyangiaceae bacterium]